MLMSKKLLLEAQFHGSRRLAERRYRFCWGIALGFFCWATSSIIIVTISRFMQTPTFLTKLENVHLSKSFPSVTICPEVTFPDYKVDAFLENINYPPGVSASELKPIIRQLAAFYSPDVVYSVQSLTIIEVVLEYNNIDIATAGRRLTVSCEEMLLRCLSFGQERNCSELFEMELTKYGFCCIFNGRSVKNSSIGSQFTEVPHQSLDKLHTFNIVVNSTQDETDIDLTYNWMYLQESQSYIEVAGNGTPIAANTEVWAGYTDIHFLIDDEIRKMSSRLQICRPSSDRLKYIPKYSKNNCLLECEIERTLEICNCSRLTHPRPPDVPYCHAESLECAKDAAVWYGSKECNCLPTCDLTFGKFVTEIVPLVAGNYITDQFYDGLDFMNVSIIRAYVAYRTYKIFSRRAVFTTEHLFSQIGGEFNVFFGCSMLTVLEILQLIWYRFKEYRNRRLLNANTKLKLQPLSKKKKKKKKRKSAAAVKTVIDLKVK